jgi:hypothetical protein
MVAKLGLLFFCERVGLRLSWRFQVGVGHEMAIKLFPVPYARIFSLPFPFPSKIRPTTASSRLFAADAVSVYVSKSMEKSRKNIERN